MRINTLCLIYYCFIFKKNLENLYVSIFDYGKIIFLKCFVAKQVDTI